MDLTICNQSQLLSIAITFLYTLTSLSFDETEPYHHDFQQMQNNFNKNQMYKWWFKRKKHNKESSHPPIYKIILNKYSCEHNF